MSYYDFDDHFWSPHEVCALAPKKETPTGFFPALLRNLREVFAVQGTKLSQEHSQRDHTRPFTWLG